MKDTKVIHGDPSRIQAVFLVKHARAFISVTFNIKYDEKNTARKSVARFLKKWRKARQLVATYYTKEGWNGIPVPRVIRRMQDIKPYTLRWLACRNICLLLKQDGRAINRWFYIPADYQTFSCDRRILK